MDKHSAPTCNSLHRAGWRGIVRKESQLEKILERLQNLTEETTMTRKSIIILVAAAVVTGALVFDGLSHRRGNQSSSQNPPMTATPAGAPSGASNTGTDAQPTAPASVTTTATNPGQNAGPAGASQPDQNGAVADAAQLAANDAPVA